MDIHVTVTVTHIYISRLKVQRRMAVAACLLVNLHKKSIGCSHAIYCVRNIVNHYVSHGSTVNLCALDITKAFDRLNHDGLFINPMRRFIPATLLNVLEKWLGMCYTYVS